jgi:hypothetical protein
MAVKSGRFPHSIDRQTPWRRRCRRRMGALRSWRCRQPKRGVRTAPSPYGRETRSERVRRMTTTPPRWRLRPVTAGLSTLPSSASRQAQGGNRRDTAVTRLGPAQCPATRKPPERDHSMRRCRSALRRTSGTGVPPPRQHVASENRWSPLPKRAVSQRMGDSRALPRRDTAVARAYSVVSVTCAAPERRQGAEPRKPIPDRNVCETRSGPDCHPLVPSSVNDLPARRTPTMIEQQPMLLRTAGMVARDRMCVYNKNEGFAKKL